MPPLFRQVARQGKAEVKRGTPQSVTTATAKAPTSLAPLPPLPAGMDQHEYDRKASLAEALVEEFHCSHDCAASTVERFYPDEGKCRTIVQAKMNSAVVQLVGLVSKQREYHDKLCADLPAAFSRFPFLNESVKTEKPAEGDTAATSNDPAIDWAAVRKALFSPDKAPLLHFHAELANVGVPSDLLVLENAYRTLVVKEGFAHLVGCYASWDGVMTAMDYVNERLCGTPVQELARRMHFAPEVVVAALNGVEANAPTVAQTCVNAFGNNPATSYAKRQDKGSSQAALRDAGLAYIRSVVTTDAREAIAQIHAGALLLPVVVKPSIGAGSEFVTLCYTDEDIAVAFEMVRGMRTSQGTDAGVLVVEEYIEGPEYVVNTVSHNGVAVVTDVWQSWKFPKAVFTTGMSQTAEQNLRSTDLSERKRHKTSILYDKQILIPDLASLPPNHEARRVTDYTLKCLDALELRNGCAHCELRVDMRKAAVRRRRREQLAKEGASDSAVASTASSTSTLSNAAANDDDNDDGDGTATEGVPVLIELNPRMQGDAPRSTEVVGYDQFSLMVYIGEAANTFGGATTVSTQLPFLQDPSRQPVRGAIPWPPVPRLYHALDTLHPPCTAVVFLVAENDCILNGFAVPFLKALPTFERFTRTIFTPNPVGYVTPLRQTVDLFSSPSACVLRGPAAQVEADCCAIRAMEAADVPAATKSMLQDAVSVTHNLLLTRSSLRNAEWNLHCLKDGADDNSAAPPVEVLPKHAEEKEEEEEVAEEARQAQDPQLLIAETQKKRDTLAAKVTEMEDHLSQLREAIRAEVITQSPPPLYICYDTFNLMKLLNLGSMLSVT